MRTLLKAEKGTETSYTAWFVYFHFPLEASIRLFVWFLLSGDTLFWYVKTPLYKWEASHMQNPEANRQMALQVPSEVPEYGKCVRFTIACLDKKVSLTSSFQDHEVLY